VFVVTALESCDFAFTPGVRRHVGLNTPSFLLVDLVGVVPKERVGNNFAGETRDTLRGRKRDVPMAGSRSIPSWDLAGVVPAETGMVPDFLE